MLVSIILPNYNHSIYLKQRLDSILNQTYQDFELIILDDASSDGSLNLLETYRNHPKVCHFEINQINTGSPFQQWQKGLKLAKGDYVWIAESDDYCDLNFLESQLECLKSQKLDVVVAQTKTVNNSNEIQNKVHHHIFKEQDVLTLDLDYFLFCPILNVSTTLFKSELVKHSTFFSSFKIIGDRVFYFESFYNRKIGLNNNTKSYFRKDDFGVSALNSKDFRYLKHYYKEHRRFAKTAFNEGFINRDLYKRYEKRFFNRINNRLSKLEKLNLGYLNLRIQHKLIQII